MAFRQKGWEVLGAALFAAVPSIICIATVSVFWGAVGLFFAGWLAGVASMYLDSPFHEPESQRSLRDE